ncbi:DNA primase [Holospora curviuscula]|uniref:DNA primase n=1 Tax=Holospora curviuscula TaxID=1082868 RepID=A0A2S5R7U8_9PROT|nr:DNA primase [Holospora curviuscula]PPE03195.1 DNA primase [Holospora curviuscula]
MDASIYTQIRHRISIVDLVSRYVKLRKKGITWSALCPFHQEKSPSFIVQELKGRYHCFGCGAHGDAVDFIKNIENITHIEALQKLAEQANIQGWKRGYENNQNSELKECLQTVCDYCTKALKIHAPSLNYLKSRGISKACQEHFKIGWCDAHVMRHIRSHFSTEILTNAGIITRLHQKNFFEERILFPIFNGNCEILGFGGRSLHPAKMPKYLNSPETTLFIKHQILYGIEHLKSNLSCVVVVEGYLDALAFWNRMPAVACLGTALSCEHLHILWRATPEPVLCFDGDAAGKKGVQKAILTALPVLKPGNTLRIASLPEGQDPQSSIQYQGWAFMESILKNASSLSEVLYETIFPQEVLSVPERRAKAVLSWKQHVETIANTEVKHAYQTFFKERFYQRSFSSRFVSRKKSEVSCTVSSVLGVEILLGALCVFPELYGEVQELFVQLHCPEAYASIKEDLIQWKARCVESSFLEGEVPKECSSLSWYSTLVQRVTPHLVFWQQLDLNALQEQWIELFNAHQTQFYLERMRDTLKHNSDLLFSQWEELKLLTFKEE